MNDIVRKSSVRTLQYYVAKGREHGFTDEELRRVVEETWNDSRRAMMYHAKYGGRPASLKSLLQVRHNQMLERRGQSHNGDSPHDLTEGQARCDAV